MVVLVAAVQGALMRMALTALLTRVVVAAAADTIPRLEPLAVVLVAPVS